MKYCSIDEKYQKEEEFIELYKQVLNKYLKLIMQIREFLHNEEFTYKKISAICKLLNISEGVVKLPSDDNKGLIEYLVKLANSLSEETGLYVGTIHSVKGLEYDCVHLVGINGKSFPINKDEEQQNVCYVGCTGAKQKLVIYNSKIVQY